MADTTYSSWNDGDIARLIPGMDAAVGKGGAWDVAKISDIYTRFIDAQLKKADALLETHDINAIAIPVPPDMKALAALLKEYEELSSQLQRAVVFLGAAVAHLPQHRDKFTAAIPAISEKIEYYYAVMNARNLPTIRILLKELDHNFLDAANELKPYRDFIHGQRRFPRKSASEVEIIPSTDRPEEQRKWDAIHATSGAAQKQALAEYLTLACANNEAGAISALDVPDFQSGHFAERKLPEKVLKNIPGYNSKEMKDLRQALKEIEKAASGKFSKTALRHYDFAEAKTIITTALGQLSPEFGGLARQAFDQGWILARDQQGGQNQHAGEGVTFPGMASGHPFIATEFHGTAMDVFSLGQHVLQAVHFHLAGKNRNGLSNIPSSPVRELFSSLAVPCIEKELLKGEPDSARRCMIRAAACGLSIGSLDAHHAGAAASEIYDLARQKASRNEGVTFDEYKNIAIKHGIIPRNSSPSKKEQKEEFETLANFAHQVASEPFAGYSGFAAHLWTGAVFAAHEKNRTLVGGKLKKAMEAGGAASIAGIWDDIVGKGVTADPAKISAQMAHFQGEISRLKDDMVKLPAPGVAASAPATSAALSSPKPGAKPSAPAPAPAPPPAPSPAPSPRPAPSPPPSPRRGGGWSQSPSYSRARGGAASAGDGNADILLKGGAALGLGVGAVMASRVEHKERSKLTQALPYILGVGAVGLGIWAAVSHGRA